MMYWTTLITGLQHPCGDRPPKAKTSLWGQDFFTLLNWRWWQRAAWLAHFSSSTHPSMTCQRLQICQLNLVPQSSESWLMESGWGTKVSLCHFASSVARRSPHSHSWTPLYVVPNVWQRICPIQLTSVVITTIIAFTMAIEINRDE